MTQSADSPIVEVRSEDDGSVSLYDLDGNRVERMEDLPRTIHVSRELFWQLVGIVSTSGRMVELRREA